MNNNLAFILIQSPLVCSAHQTFDTFEALHITARVKQAQKLDKQKSDHFARRLQQLNEYQNSRPAICAASRKIMAHRKEVHDFYTYSTQWRSDLQRKVHMQRNGDGTNQTLDLSTHTTKSSVPPSQASKLVPENYEGPIKGWHTHFYQYLKARTQQPVPEAEIGLFRPAIDKYSEEIVRKKQKQMQQNAGLPKPLKVEERLLKYADERRAMREIQQEPQTNIPQNKAKPVDPHLYDRLYYEAEKRYKQRMVAEAQTRSSFKPSINSNTVYEQRVSQIRKPLYYVKKAPAEPNPRQSDHPGYLKSQQFMSFLERNQLLVHRKNEDINRVKAEKEQNVEQYSFKPSLNPHSLVLVENMKARTTDNKNTSKDSQQIVIQLQNTKVQSKAAVPAKAPGKSIPHIRVTDMSKIEAMQLDTQESAARRSLPQQSTRRTPKNGFMGNIEMTLEVKGEDKDDDDMVSDVVSDDQSSESSLFDEKYTSAFNKVESKQKCNDDERGPENVSEQREDEFTEEFEEIERQLQEMLMNTLI